MSAKKIASIVATLLVLLVISPVASAEPTPTEDNKAVSFKEECLENYALSQKRAAAIQRGDDPSAIEPPTPVEVERAKKSASGFANCVITAGIAHPIDATKAAFNKAKSFWNDPIGKFTKAVLEGNQEALIVAMTFWMDYGYKDQSELNANVQGVKNIVLGVSAFALAASFLVGGARLAASRRRGLQEGAEEIGEVVARWFIFSACIPGAVAGGLWATDALSNEMMGAFGVGSIDQAVEVMKLDSNSFGPVVTLLLAGIAIAGSVMQIIALVVRMLILPIAAGLTPLFAAASFTETGKSGLNHLVAYMIAAIIFKPVSALLYCVVMWNVTRPTSAEDHMSAIINALMIGVAGFVAPALVRAIVPAASMAGGGSAGAALGGAAAGAGVVLGAVGGVAGKGAGLVAGGSTSAMSGMASAASGGIGAASGGAGAALGGRGGATGGGSGSGGGAVPVGAGGGTPGGGSGGGAPSAGPSASPGGAGGGTPATGGAGLSASPAGSPSSPGGRSSSLGNAPGSPSSGISTPQSGRQRAAAVGKKAASVAGKAAAGAAKGVGHGGRFAMQATAVAAPAAARGAQHLGTAAGQMGQMFEGSLGYPGQIHR